MKLFRLLAALAALLTLAAPVANAQCYDRPAWHGSGYNWNGGHGGYYEPYYTYHYRSYRSYRSWRWDEFD
jgi:hypothetical protein